MLTTAQDWKAHFDCIRWTILAWRYAATRARLLNPRSHITGYTATVFGATGFLGRYIVNRLGVWKPLDRWGRLR
jgi:hypothetical protein